ncbi:OsmC family protein [Promethearchaeum syntrophicum]|uniref:OsmC family protein n=1 Tax=Promethearchaeum syntrophicum TaxID=2594042 RepID=A0A5B9DD01_9ARCH|nr:OsmC family protein [Candidatus Prometheoarchaeum syntrophicum]QEE17004.1 OsmC-like protein [Candidatus Prometheoarchaeum syntrophicum]
MEFKLDLFQTDKDLEKENNFEKTCKISVSKMLPRITLQLPPEYGGLYDENKNTLTYTPEDMYMAAITGCFFTTFSVVSQNSNLQYENIDISASGLMDVLDDVKMMTEISLNITLTLPKGMEKNERKAMKVLEIAEKRCPIANSVKTKIKNTYRINFSNR